MQLIVLASSELERKNTNPGIGQGQTGENPGLGIGKPWFSLAFLCDLKRLGTSLSFVFLGVPEEKQALFPFSYFQRFNEFENKLMVSDLFVNMLPFVGKV